MVKVKQEKNEKTRKTGMKKIGKMKLRVRTIVNKMKKLSKYGKTEMNWIGPIFKFDACKCKENKEIEKESTEKCGEVLLQDFIEIHTTHFRFKIFVIYLKPEFILIWCL